MEGDVIQLQDIFLYKREGFGPDGKVRGQHVATGQIPEFYEELATRGLEIDFGMPGAMLPLMRSRLGRGGGVGRLGSATTSMFQHCSSARRV